jgi:hypothetical protein
MNFFDRIANSFSLAKSSWRVLWTDKQLIVFPFVSGIACLVVLASFAVPFALVPGMLDGVQHAAEQRVQPPPWVYAYAFAFYFCNYFVIVFCNSALVSCALVRLNGGTPTLSDGFGMAFRRLPQILAWALVSATVGVLLRVIENSNEKVGAIISSIVGTVWTIMTYFVVPVLVVEQVGPFTAIKRSCSILKKTWGEALVGSMGLGIFKFLLMIPGIIVVVIGLALLSVNLIAAIAVIGMAVLYFVVAAGVGAAMDGIYLTALYQFATTGTISEEFESHAMTGAFYGK